MHLSRLAVARVPALWIADGLVQVLYSTIRPHKTPIFLVQFRNHPSAKGFNFLRDLAHAFKDFILVSSQNRNKTP